MHALWGLLLADGSLLTLITNACPFTGELLTTVARHNGIITHLLVQAADFFDDKETFQSLCEVLCQILQRLTEVSKRDKTLRSNATSCRTRNTRKRRRPEDAQQLVHDAASCSTLQVWPLLV